MGRSHIGEGNRGVPQHPEPVFSKSDAPKPAGVGEWVPHEGGEGIVGQWRPAEHKGDLQIIGICQPAPLFVCFQETSRLPAKPALAESRKQKTENRKQKTENRKQKTDAGRRNNALHDDDLTDSSTK